MTKNKKKLNRIARLSTKYKELSQKFQKQTTQKQLKIKELSQKLQKQTTQKQLKIKELEKAKGQIQRLKSSKSANDDHLHQLHNFQKDMTEIKPVVEKFREVKTLSSPEKTKVRNTTNLLKKKTSNIYSKTGVFGKFPMLGDSILKTIYKRIIPLKFPNNYYQFLKKIMWAGRQTYPAAKDIIDAFSSTDDRRGQAFEALWTILIILGFCEEFPKDQYRFYDAELKKKPYYFIKSLISTKDQLYYLKNTRVKGVNGKSDITLRRKEDGKWVFISCKYYSGEKGDYDIGDIYKAIKGTNEIYPNMIHDTNYEIYAFVKNKNEAIKKIKNSRTVGSIENIDNVIKTDDDYNILGIDELEKCYTKFLEEAKQFTSLDDFVRTFIQQPRYNSDRISRSIQLRSEQDDLVRETMEIINEKKLHKQCGWNEPTPLPPLRLYWKTPAQFGKTYCIGKLFLKYYRQYGTFNAVVVADNLEVVARKYSTDIMGGYEQMIGARFNLINVVPDTKDKSVLSNLLATPPDKKAIKKIQQNRNKNNILFVSTKNFKLVKNLPDITFAVFDEFDHPNRVYREYFESSEDLFHQFTNPPKIGLFLTSSIHSDEIRVDGVCSKILLKQQTQMRQQQQQQQQQQKKTQTKQSIETCLMNKVKLNIVTQVPPDTNQKSGGGGVSTRTTSVPLWENILKALEVIDELKQSSPSTQLWFTSSAEESKSLIQECTAKNSFENYYFVNLDEPDHPHPPPITNDPQRLVSFYQQSAQKRRKVLVLVSSATRKFDRKFYPNIIRGASFPKVDVVFALNHITLSNEAWFQYIMMSKCRTPRPRKQSAYFVDFNHKRVCRLIQKYFGTDPNKVENLIEVKDINRPTNDTDEVLERLDIANAERDRFGTGTRQGQSLTQSQLDVNSTIKDFDSIFKSKQGSDIIRSLGITNPEIFNGKEKLNFLFKANGINLPQPYRTKSTKGELETQAILRNILSKK